MLFEFSAFSAPLREIISSHVCHFFFNIIMSLPDLITSDRAGQNASLAALSSSNPAYLASLITAASDCIRHATHRDFSQTSYTEYHSGGIYIREPLRLRQYPVVEISRIATNPQPAISIQNSNGVTNQRATIETTSTGIRLVRIASANVSTSDLAFSTYTTLGSVASAINAIGNGWTAQSLGTFANWPTTDLKPLQGAVSALGVARSFEIYTEDVSPFSNWPPGDCDDAAPGWRLDDETGQLYARFPRGHLNIRIDYTAGFSAIPQAVQEACVQLACDLYNAGLVNTTLKKATLGAGSFELKDQSSTAVLSGKVSMLLARYVDYSRTIFR
jgi:hypothetical protein